MDRLNKVKFHVDRMLNYLETHEGLTDEEKGKYGYTKSYYGSREHYDAYLARKYIAYEYCDRSQITKTMLKDMKKFLDIAQKLGFIGDVWFKTGYNDGMFATTRTGNDIAGELVLYHTFSSDTNYFLVARDRNKVKRKNCTPIYTKNELKNYLSNNM